MIAYILSLIKNLSSKQIILVFFFIGLLIYGNSLTNDFVGDDLSLIVNNPNIKSITNVPNLFFQGSYTDNAGNNRNNYYKPLQVTTLSIIYFFFWGAPFGFHLIQVLLHISNTILIFLILKRFLGKFTSLLMSLIFLTHPINVEAVAYISAMQEPLFMFFGLCALYFSLKSRGVYTPWLITIALTLSVLSKETGIVFVLIVPVVNYLFKKQDFWVSVKFSIYSLSIYSFLRFLVAHIYFPQNPIVPIMAFSLAERIISIPKIAFFYLKTFFYPVELIFSQSWTVKNLNVGDFYLPLVIDGIFLLSVIIFGWLISKKDKDLFKNFAFFFVWFAIGLGVHLQIVPLDQTVAERWFYFPIVGLLGIIGVVANYLRRGTLSKAGFTVLLVFLLVILFSVRVINRNADWKNDFALLTHDILLNPDSHQLESGLGNVYRSRGDNLEAEKHFIKSASLFPGKVTFSALGGFYFATEEFKKAINAFENALEYDSNNVSALSYLAIAKYKLGAREEALIAINKAYNISPSDPILKIKRIIEADGEVVIK